MLLFLRQKNAEHGLDGGVGVVLYGIYPRDRPPSFPEGVRLGLQAQLESLLDPWVPLQSYPEGTIRVPRVAHTDPPPAPYYPNHRGQALFRQSVGRYQNPRQLIMCGYWRTCGGSLTQDSPRSEILCAARASSDASDTRLLRA